MSARTETQLPQATIELVHSRGPCSPSHLPAAAIEWATVLTATALPEGQPYPRSVRGARRPARRDRGRAVGERLGRGAGPIRAAAPCASSASALISTAARSPAATTIWSRSARSRAARSAPQRPSPMPASSCRCRRSFARAGGASWPEIAQGLDLTGHFLARDVLDRPRRARSPKRATGSSTGCAAPVVSPRLGAVTHRHTGHALPERRGNSRHCGPRRGELPRRAVGPVEQPLVLVLSRADRERLARSRSSCCRAAGRSSMGAGRSTRSWARASSAKCR